MLAPLLETLQERSREQGLSLDRETLKLIVATSIAYHKLAKDREVRGAGDNGLGYPGAQAPEVLACAT